MYDAKDFGCLGNGTKDDFEALQRAVTSAAGDVLQIGSGHYRLAKRRDGSNPSVKIQSGTTILMARDAVILSEGNIESAKQWDNWRDAVFTNSDPDNGNRDIKLIGGVFRRAGQKFGGNTFICFRNVQNLILEGVELSDIFGRWKTNFIECRNLIITNLRGGYTKNEPGAPDWFWHPYHNDKTNTYKRYQHEDTIHISGGCNNFTIANCHIDSGDDAIAVNNESFEAYGGHEEIIEKGVVKDCAIESRWAQAIRIYNEKKTKKGGVSAIKIRSVYGAANTWSNQNLRNIAHAIRIEDETDRKAVEGILLLDCRMDCSYQIEGKACGMLISKARDVALDRCLFEAPYAYGICAENSERIAVRDSVISGVRNNDYEGIHLEATINAAVERNVIEKCATHAILVKNCSSATIQRNIIRKCNGHGILLQGATKSNIVENIVSKSTLCSVKEESGTDYTICWKNDVSQGQPIDKSHIGAHSQYTNNIEPFPEDL
jgi:parallel beta-helix repeat protein